MEIVTVEQGTEIWFAQQSADYLRLSNQSVVVFSSEEGLMKTIINLIKEKSRNVDVCVIKRVNARPVAVVHREGYAVDVVKPARVRPVPVIAQIYLFTMDNVTYRLIEKRLVGI